MSHEKNVAYLGTYSSPPVHTKVGELLSESRPNMFASFGNLVTDQVRNSTVGYIPTMVTTVTHAIRCYFSHGLFRMMMR